MTLNGRSVFVLSLNDCARTATNIDRAREIKNFVWLPVCFLSKMILDNSKVRCVPLQLDYREL